MNNEYIIVNKTALEKRIEELVISIPICILPEQQHLKDLLEQELGIKRQLLSQSTPLIPEIKKAWKDGRDGTKVVGNFPFIGTQYINKTSQDYISKLKLNI